MLLGVDLITYCYSEIFRDERCVGFLLPSSEGNAHQKKNSEFNTNNVEAFVILFRYVSRFSKVSLETIGFFKLL
jgi:hypothetical protein